MFNSILGRFGDPVVTYFLIAMAGTLGDTELSRRMPFEDVRNRIPTWRRERNEQEVENLVCFLIEEDNQDFMHPMIVERDGRCQMV